MGLLLVSKQYMFIIAAPALIMLRPRDGGWIGYIKWCGKAFLAGAMVSLPLMLWNLPAYIHSNFAAAASAGLSIRCDEALHIGLTKNSRLDATNLIYG